MALPKYKKFYQLMREQNNDLFESFRPVHDAYAATRENQELFHTKGQEVVDVIRDWERRLCSGMERGRNGQYSNKLAEKFWEEVKSEFSHIELVGVRTTFNPAALL